MYFLLVIFIAGVIAIIGIVVSSHYRNRGNYKRIFVNGAPARRRRMAGDGDSSFEMLPFGSGGDSGHHSHHSHDSHCDTGHAGGDVGGSCSDGGSGGADGSGH